jgi:hypothetical protein
MTSFADPFSPSDQHQEYDITGNLVVLTRTCEYHLKNGVCLAVRTRHLGWLPGHPAVGQMMIQNHPHYPLRVGSHLIFEKQLVTGTIQHISLPTDHTIESYAFLPSRMGIQRNRLGIRD